MRYNLMLARPEYFMPILPEAGKRKLFPGSGQIGTVKGGMWCHPATWRTESQFMQRDLPCLLSFISQNTYTKLICTFSKEEIWSSLDKQYLLQRNIWQWHLVCPIKVFKFLLQSYHENSPRWQVCPWDF